MWFLRRRLKFDKEHWVDYRGRVFMSYEYWRFLKNHATQQQARDCISERAIEI